jgi:DEAD/DEAH box helicase domain-containing protein
LYGARPTYIFSSATIGNPDQLVHQLSGLEVSVVAESGAPAGCRHVVFMNPDTSPAQTAIELLKAALPRGLRTIVYTQSRRMTELIAMWAADRAGKFRSRISAYRAGYLPAERRQIESRLASGDLLAVISTSALELGIDIGHLDLCILVGYPGSVVATQQRGGRVGRGGQDSALVIIGGDDALDQYIMRHPEEVMSRTPERAIVHPDNPVILAMHMECAAAELPLHDSEENLRPAAARAVLDDLEKKGRLLRTAGGRTIIANRGAPHRNVNLRGGGDRFQIVDAMNHQRIGEIDAFRIYRETHPGAVYLHRGHSYIVDQLDERERNVTVSRQAVDYFTRVKSHKKTEIIQTEAIRDYDRCRFCFGHIKVTDQVYGYEVLRVRDRMVLDQASLEAPPQIFETQAMWLTLPRENGSWLGKKQLDLLGGLHAVEHAAISMFPFLVMADRNDIGGLATEYHAQTGTATIFIYDGFPGGVGLSRQAFQQHRGLIDLTLGALQNCPCEDGCPSCIQSPKCGNGNRPLDKSLAIRLLDGIKKTVGSENSEGARERASVATTDLSEGRDIIDRTGAETSIQTAGDFGVVDLETQLSAAEVGGWQYAHRMKVSCGVVYDSRQDRFLEFMADQVPELILHLKKMDFIIGFNIKGFDYKVLSAYSQMNFGRLKTLDILEAVHHILGYRLSLNHLAEVTLNEPKKADGLQALQWWREGRLRELVDYCRHDVQLTRDLYLYGRQNGYLLFRDKAQRVLRIPVDWE